jgi:hypothetical protein
MATKKKEPKRVWAWGQKGSNGLVFAITLNENVANGWRKEGATVVELVENEC